MLTNIIDYIRFALYGVLVLIALLLFQQWGIEHPKPTIQPVVATSPTSNYIPQVSAKETTTAASASAQPIKAVPIAGNLVHVQTDVLSADISTQGGDITQLKLLKYPKELHSTDPVVLMNEDSATRYIAQSGLLSSIGPDTSQGQAIYQSEQSNYVLDANENTLKVNLTWQKEGVKVTKTYTFKRNDYEIDLNYQVNNASSKPWEGNLYLQLLRTNAPTAKNGFLSLATYFGAAISSPEKPYKKISFKAMTESNLNESIPGGWAAMIQHYFVSAWVPESTVTSQYYSRVTGDGLYTIGMMNSPIQAKPGETAETHAKFYAGPAIADRLEAVSHGLPLTLDYGIFWFLSVPIFWLMQKIYNVFGNWGVSIILVTVVIKLLFYHLSAKSYRSMAVLKKLQPKIEALKQRYGDDKQKFTQATLELYKKEKANPMSGCLPMLIQIPVFIALYWVLVESVQLRHAPFILWIHDLSSKDPYYVLPLLMGVTMFLQQRLNPPPPDPVQAKVFMFMPVLFTVMFISFPAGLMLYWVVNNLLTFAQQWFIMRNMEQPHKAKKKTA